jgi:peroxiredoxin Q/BCP
MTPIRKGGIENDPRTGDSARIRFVQVGDRFPVDELGIPSGDGPVIVYFYPRAGTPGCTVEAQEFNRRYDELGRAGVRLIGVSVDPADANEEFANECDLRFPLHSDTSGELTTRLGLMKRYGDYGEMAARVTVLVDENGVVEEVWRVDDEIPAHVEEVVERSTRQRER